MRRRSLLAVPLFATIWPVQARRAWRHDVSEVRYGDHGPGAAPRALALARHLGVPVRAVRLPPAALAAAMSAGHLEMAALDGAGLRIAAVLMGERLIATPGGAVRRALPIVLRDDLLQALAATAA